MNKRSLTGGLFTTRYATFQAILFAALLSSCSKSTLIKPSTPTGNTTGDKQYKTANIAVPASGLIAYWSFDNTGNDLSGNHNDGTLHNVSSATDRFGNPLGAYHFEGTNDSYITVPDNNMLRLNNTDFTMNAWVKLDNYRSTNGGQILNKRVSGVDNGWSWGIAGTGGATPAGDNIFGPGGAGINAVGTKAVSINQWHMVTCAYSFSRQQLTIYVDGVLDNVSDYISTPSGAVQALLYIGRDNPVNPTDYAFQGSLDDISIYNSEFSASSIIQLYQATASKASPNLIAYWPFDNSGADLSGNWNNAAIHNVSSSADRFNNPIGAYHFNGTDTYLSVADNTSLRLNNTDFTLNTWVQIDAYSSNIGSLFISKNAGAGNGWLLGVAGYGVVAPFVTGAVSYELGKDGQYAWGTTPIPLHQWHMVTAVYTLSTQQLSIYIDGVLDHVRNNVPTPNASTTAMLYIGRNDPGVAGNSFQGSLDGIGIYNSALSVSNIQQLYTATH